MVSTTQGQIWSPEKEKFYWNFCIFERTGLVAGKGHLRRDNQTKTVTQPQLFPMETCSAAQPQLPHHFTHRFSFLQRPWDSQTQAQKDTATLPSIWALTSNMAFYQPHFRPSSSTQSVIKQLSQSKGWLYR